MTSAVAVAEIASNPTIGQAVALTLFNEIQSDASLTLGMLAFNGTQSRLAALKAGWERQIQGLLKNWSDDQAALVRVYVRGQRPAVVQLFLSLNKLALNSPEERANVEAEVDALMQGVLARIVKPSGKK